MFFYLFKDLFKYVVLFFVDLCFVYFLGTFRNCLEVFGTFGILFFFNLPTPAVCAKHLRAITGKVDEARAAGMFQCVSTLEALAEKCQLVKEALRVAQLYINPSGTTKKNHEDSFISAFEKLPVTLLHKFPRVMLDRFYHLIHAKDNAFCWVGWTVFGVVFQFAFRSFGIVGFRV